ALLRGDRAVRALDEVLVDGRFARERREARLGREVCGGEERVARQREHGVERELARIESGLRAPQRADGEESGRDVPEPLDERIGRGGVPEGTERECLERDGEQARGLEAG